ncbi:MAG: dihydrofolate reductase [Bacteroidia bacterium]|nr:dihydrofolate reductase [Bacteroidia bacterium]
MRNIILNLAVSLDGYIAGPNGEYDWCFTDADYGMKDFFNRIDATIMGGVSYRLTKSMGENPYPHIVNHVISRNEPDPGAANVKMIRDDIDANTRRLKDQPGKDIWLFGGAQIIEVMLAARLVDELMLAVHPVTLGQGIPLFPRASDRQTWQLKKSIPYPSGLVQLVYTA